MSEEIIAVQTADFNGSQVQCVSVRTLYEFLGSRKNHFSRWCQRNIVDNIFAIEGKDYIIIAPPGESNDYLLTIDFAKKLCMVTATPKGEEVRQYFLDIEKAYNRVVSAPKVPMTYLEALEAQIELVKKLESQGVQLETATKTIEKLTHVGKLYTATEIAKELGIRSAEQLNKELEEMNIQYKVNNTWVLRSWYADKGYTSIKQMELDNGRIVYDRKWTGTGREFLLGKFKETKLLPAGE